MQLAPRIIAMNSSERLRWSEGIESGTLLIGGYEDGVMTNPFLA